MSENPTTPMPARAGRRLRPGARWAVPGVAAVAVAAAFAVPALASASDEADLPDIEPAELLAAVAQADQRPLSGTVVYTARLGLPDVPLADVAAAGPATLLGGSTTIRVWSDGADRSRVGLLGATSEFSVVQDGLETWTYSSAENQVVHYAPAAEDAQALESLLGDDAAMGPATLGDPDALATAVLGAVEEYSIVTMDADTTVAGRDAYQLVVTPEDAQTLVGRVVVAVDGETSMPLRLQVWSTEDSQAPALEVGYTDLSYDAPDPDVLEFSVPVGATVQEVEIPLPDLGSLAGMSGAELPQGLEGLSDVDLADLHGLADLDPGELEQRLGVDPAELERIAGLDGPERIAAMQELLAGLDLGALGVDGLDDVDLSGLDLAALEADAHADGTEPGEPEGMRVLGSGWGTVLELSGMEGHLPGTPEATDDAAEPTDPAATPGEQSAEDLFAELDQSLQGMHDGADVDLFDTLATQVPEGRLVTSALLSILMTDDGRVLVGAVPGDVLRELA